ncbi:Hypothetical predicted protein [Mytilus galloprovincialis]|uniref:Uncharacterized protein n=1 Tax=Mytilus galloprovincialis TaxID=29158 RepID=A0A8B6E9B4_MYTGA|nr:Hypothetical predicted protein [Mytilus galloprovincialis]
MTKDTTVMRIQRKQRKRITKMSWSFQTTTEQTLKQKTMRSELRKMLESKMRSKMKHNRMRSEVKANRM